MVKEKIELTLQDESGQEYVAYPFVESEDVTLSNGMDIETMIAQDVSMPIVTHEETSFKVGVGDSDISNSIVDSSVANMTIKGQTYQNILPDPTLRNSMTDGKTMQKLNEGYESVNTVDGVCKSAILSGQTLVSLANNPIFRTAGDSNSFTRISVENGMKYVKNDKDTSVYPRIDLDSNASMLKENTEYTLIFTINTDRTNFHGINISKGTDAYSSYGDYYYRDTQYNVTNGTHKITFTTPSKTEMTKNFKIGFGSFTLTHENMYVTITNVMVLEGDYTNKEVVPYFTGMASCKMPVLTTTGKNLFDGHLQLAWDTVYTPVNFLQVQENKNYVISEANSQLKGATMYCFDENKNKVATLDGTSKTIPNGVKYIKWYVSINNGVDVSDIKIQIEQGTQATSYEPYKSNILSTQINLTSDMFEQGGVTTSAIGASYSAVKTSRTDRIRVKELIPIKPNTSYYFKAPDGFGGWCNFYDANGLLLNTTSLNSDSARITSSTTYYAGIVLNKANSSLDVTPSEISGKTVCLGEEVVLRSLPNGVKDTLNLMTGEYVQRIGEIVVDGGEGWSLDTTTPTSENTLLFFTSGNYAGFKPLPNYGDREIGILCDKFKVMPNAYHIDEESMMVNQEARVYIRIAKSKLSTQDVSGFKTWLQSNNVKVSALLNTPVVKTVDLSTYGNWDKVILDGSEEWLGHTSWSSGDFLAIQTPIPNKLSGGLAFTDSEDFKGMSWKDSSVDSKPSKECVRYDSSGLVLYVFIKKSRLADATIDEFKQWLSNNPITVWYQTATFQTNDVKQPLSFKDGHISISTSDNSLIPSMSYEVPTSNSYHMDLMKTNTRYTMKAKSASGTFTIDGTSYGAGTNGTFTSPTSMTNKLLVMSNKTNEEVMILEGDVVSKTIPYFKGIKSAFEDESKIEVLSTGKNLIDETLWTKSIIEDGVECLYGDGWYSSSGSVGTPILIPVDIKQGKRYRISVTHKATTHFNNYKILQDCLNNRIVGGAQSVCILDRLNTFTESNTSFVANFDAKYLMVDTGNPKCYGYIKKGTLIIEEIERDGIITTYEPYKSNYTNIQLPSPLRSLPNGVKDELVIDRDSNKVKLIQRVGKVVLDGSSDEGWAGYIVHAKNVRIQKVVADCLKGDNISPIYATCDKLPSVVWHNSWTQDYNLITFNVGSLFLQLSDTSMVKEQMLSWLTRNPITVYYQLATPVITEVDLNGYPHIYKDGHIFLNTDIAPTSEIKYSINQSHMIEASNEDLMRHEKKITNLHKLIGAYVNVEYESTLLALNLELK